MSERFRSPELRGLRQAPLMIHDYSHKTRKPPTKKPVIIYMVSPKVIHVDPSEFMALVQRLTGPDSSPTSDPLQPPPAAPCRREKESRQFPVRVKARALHRSSSEPSPTLFLHDLSSPPCSSSSSSSIAVKEGSAAAAPPSWLLHGDFLSQAHHACLPSPSYLDLFSQLPDQQS